MWQANTEPDFEYQLNAYDSFMRRHLQHYGYYTGRNQNYRQTLSSYADWEKTFAYTVSSGESTNSDSDCDSELGKGQDNKLQEELMRTTQLVYSYQDGKGMVPKLREPRNLYALAKELGPQQLARWPYDIQVIDERIKHVRHIPSEAEPFYRIHGRERTPMVRGEEHGGRLVFWYEPRCSFFVRSRVGGIRSGPEQCAVRLESNEDKTLIFESRFESGNLAKAVQVGEFEYELWLRYDLYTSKSTQWFYFRVSNTRAGVPYRFTIVNFMKPDSLYNNGMKPIMYSDKEAKVNKVGWIRSGHDIRYYKNNTVYETGRSEKPFYSLTWSVQLPHGHDNVYFAHCYPYTYTDLQDYLLDLSNDPIKSKICKQRVLCRTLAGNLVYVLTITSPSQNPEDIKHKKAVVLTSRVHPGESNASWMMKGFLDYLTGNSADAKLLRDTFIFKIVPMMNPDGVIVGNYRCSLAGRDLNRNYKTVLKESYPSVWHTKTMIRRLLQEREIIVYCDLHGHSRKQNVFIYGCENRHMPERRLRERIFPVMLHKNCPDKFSFDYCKFKVQKSKEGTGRIVMWHLGISNSYTMEATFCGSTLGKKKGFHFNLADYEAMGYHFCDSLLDYCDPDKSKSTNILFDLEERVKLEIITRMERLGLPASEVDFSDEYTSGIESSDGGSDSSVSDGPPVHLQFTAARVSKKKKKLRTKKERDRVKDEAKKATQDRPSSDDKKPMSGHQTAHARQDKPVQSVKYTTAKLKRPKSLEERSTGVPVCVHERRDERQPKKNEYLEALTTAYLHNGLIINEPAKLHPRAAAPHLRYSGSNKADTGQLTFTLDGLCPHHEQTFAAQYMAQQIQNVPSGENELDEMLRSQLTRQVSISPISRQPQQRHILEVSAAQQKQQELLREQRNSAKEKTNIKQHPNPFEERSKSGRPRTQIPSATFVNYETFNVSRVPSSSSAEWLMDNVHGGNSANHVDLDASGNQQPGDNISPQEADSVQLQMKEPCQKGYQGHRKSGRQSRMGMYEEEKVQAASDLPDYVKDPHSHKGPRVKSARGSEDVNSAIDSIRELRQSLATSAVQQKLSPTAGHYIKRLIEQTDENLNVLTHEIQDNIKQKKKLVNQMKTEEISRDNAVHVVMEAKRVPSASNTRQQPKRVSSATNNSQQQVNRQLNPVINEHQSAVTKPVSSETTNSGKVMEKTALFKERTSSLKRNRLARLPPSTDDATQLTAANMPTSKHFAKQVNPSVQNVNKNNVTIKRSATSFDYGFGGTDGADKAGGRIGGRMAGRGSTLAQVNMNGALDNTYYSSNNTTYQLYTKMLTKIARSQGQGEGSGNSSSSADDKRRLSASERQESQYRVKSARSSRQVVETVPTKVQLTISDGNDEGGFGGQFLPLSRTIKAPFHRNHGAKRK